MFGRRLKIRDFGTCLDFSSTSHQVVAAGGDWLGTGDITISAWIKPRTLGASNLGRIIHNGQISIRLVSVNTLSAACENTTFVTAAANSITLKKWQHVVITITAAGLINFYVNGVQSGTANQSGGARAAGSTVYIGNNNASRNFDGLIDAVRIFSRILTDIEIANLYYDGQLPTVAANVNTNLLAEYLFNEGGGTTANDTGPYARTGTITGAIYSPDVAMRPRLKVRDFGSCLDFKNATDKVDLGASDIIGTGDVTICAWINPRSLGGSSLGRIIDNSKFLLTVSSNARVQAASDGSTFVTSLTNSILLDGKWKFVVVTRTSTGMINFYINGAASGTPNSSSGVPAAGTTNCTIGNNSAGTRNFDGKIDALKIFKKILDPGEINALYVEGRLPSVVADVSTSLAAEYLFNEGSGSTALDSGPYARNGTITGATYSTDVISIPRTAAGNRLKVRDFGTALLFPGSTNKVVGNSIPSLGAAATIACWFKTNNIGLTQQIINNATNTNDRFCMSLQSGILRGGYFNGSAVGSKSLSGIKQGVWYFAVYTFDGVMGTLSANLIPSNGTSNPGTASTANFIAGIRSSSDPFSGVIDTIRCWTRVLNATEISNLYYLGIVPRNSLALEWLFNEGSGSSAVDTSGFGNNGVITAATYTTDVPIIPRTLV